MPAQDKNQTKRATKVFRHIYNKVIEERELFATKSDYKTFLDFVRDYLTPPKDPESTKKTFKVKGRVFKGIPHQPKNYFGKIELVAFSLMPDHFHLILHEKEKGSLEKFLRSLSTRYAIYYNKKYKRKGSLFTGPYKSTSITNPDKLVHLSLYLHQESLQAGNETYSSYPEYKNDRANSWLNPKVILSYFKGKDSYETIVQNYRFNEKELDSVKRIAIETVPDEFERSVLEPKSVSFKEDDSAAISESRVKIPTFMAASSLMFLLLLSLGIRNVNTSVAQTQGTISSLPSPSLTPTPLASTNVTSPIVLGEEGPELKTMAIIKIDDGAESVNIRSGPSTEFEILGKASDGEKFEFVSETQGWYEIKFEDKNAFVFRRYALIEGEVEQ